MAAAAAEQWRITWAAEGEADITEMTTRFADAWALSQNVPGYGELDWQFMPRQFTLDEFNQNNANAVTVARTADGTHRVTIERM
jgi:hypothetical protein